MKLPVLPVRSHNDSTLDFQRLQRRLTEFDQSVAMAHCTEKQKIPSGVVTKVKTTTIDSDPGLNFQASGAYRVPADGYYQAHGHTSILIPANGYFAAYVMVGGVIWLTGSRTVSPIEIHGMSMVSGILRLKKGEEIELAAFQNAAGEHELSELGAGSNRLHIVRVA